MVRADAPAGSIAEFSVYCTGDWDDEQRSRHQADVRLIRP
jgi:hypothetical protein